MAKLYPPYIEGTIPAFYSSGTTTNIVVPFSMNKAVGKTEVYGFALKLKYVDGTIIDTFKVFSNDLIASFPELAEQSSGSYNLTNMTVTFSVHDLVNNYLVPGQYYKLQLAYLGDDLGVGYYSSIGVIKYTTRPTLGIQGLNSGEINNHQYTYVGVYDQKERDVTEKVYQYRFQVYDENENLVDDSGYLLHNIMEDDLPYQSRDSYSFLKDIDDGSIYQIVFSVITNNGIEMSSPPYRITQLSQAQTENHIGLNAKLNYENGYIKLTLNSEEKLISGAFLICKSCSKDNYAWTEYKRFDANSMVPSDWSVIDCTIEQGYYYRYSLQQYNNNAIYSARIITQEIYVDFEHAFLYDGKKQLKISYNPKITNFKNNIQESKTDTIGSKYPFIIKNGNTHYKSFDIQGLISLQSDEEGLFLNKNKYSTDDIVSDLTSKNITAERIFKREVLEWLNNGEPKIFKSPTEGNFIVRLLNVSLTPNDTVGRMLHSFKATAYEIGEYDVAHLSKYHLIDTGENLSSLRQWATIDVLEECKKYPNQTNWIPLLEDTFYSVELRDFVPGTIVRLTGNNSDRLGDTGSEIMIGVTGAYTAKSDTGFSRLEIRPKDFDVDFVLAKPLITYSFNTKIISVFSMIATINIENIPLHQIIGLDGVDNNNILGTLNDAASTVQNFNIIRFKKRDIYEIYINCDTPEDFRTTQSYTYYKDAELSERINTNKLSKLGIYQLKCKNSGEKINYYVDGNDKEIYPITNTLFNIVINNNEIIDIKDSGGYEITKTDLINNLIINPGIITELSYSRQIANYEFDLNMNEQIVTNYNNARSAYLTSTKNFNTILKSKLSSIGHMTDADILSYTDSLDNETKRIKNLYKDYIAKLDIAIAEYKRQHDLT